MADPKRFEVTPSSASGLATTAGANTLVAAENGFKIRVLAYALTTRSTTGQLCIFKSGDAGDELWRVDLKAPTDISTGANLAIGLPAFLFSTDEGKSLTLNLSGGDDVHYSVSYFREAA